MAYLTRCSATREAEWHLHTSRPGRCDQRPSRSASDGAVTFRELSEGERQLLTVLGLLRFTAEDESLILLDEPDTHLNPIWSVKYLQFLSEFIGGTSSGQETSHVIMTTHNPIAIAELSKEQVQIPQVRDGRKVAATFPDEDPRGMGYASIVTSSMFGIPSYLDAPTQLDLERQRQLSHQASRTAAEDADLEEVTARLDKLGFRFFVPDDEYLAFPTPSLACAGGRFRDTRCEPDCPSRRRHVAARTG